MARYTCFRVSSPLVIDGKLDEPAWLNAPVSNSFVDIVSGRPAWFDTRVRLLWDDQYLYFGFTAEETDVWGTLTNAIERSTKKMISRSLLPDLTLITNSRSVRTT